MKLENPPPEDLIEVIRMVCGEKCRRYSSILWVGSSETLESSMERAGGQSDDWLRYWYISG